MPSVAMTEWETSGAMRLDELEQVHADSRRGTSGRPWGTRQLNRTLFVALVAQFQVYCRDLHDLAIDVQLSATNPHQIDLLRTLLTRDRKLDVQNPGPGNLGSDFNRLGFELIPALKVEGPTEAQALDRLDTLVKFRNAVAHGNERAIAGFAQRGEITATLSSYRQYRTTLRRLVATMDRVVAAELAAGLRIPLPW
jgi:hypothetical protein